MDAAAFDEAYRQHGPRVYAFLVRLCGRRDLAEDLYQDTWLKLARHSARLPPDANVAAWLFTVARNEYRSWRRWTWVDLDRKRSWLDETPHNAAGTDARASLADAERAIARLSPALREVLLLVAVEGLAHEEVARILGLEVATVRKRLSRARAQIGGADHG